MTGPAPPADAWLDAALLSFVAAFVDTACFIGLFGLFTAHVTGNFVLIGAALLSPDGAVLNKLLALPVFVLAVAATALLARALRTRRRAPAAPLLGAQAALLLLAAVLAGALARPAQADDATALSIGMLVVVAMGVQNALMRIDLAALPPTTVMTGNVTQVVIDLLMQRPAPGDPDPSGVEAHAAAHARLRRMLPGIAAFMLGSAAGAGGYGVVGLPALAFPAMLCAVLAWRLRGP